MSAFRRGPAWRCKGTGELRYGVVPAGVPRPPRGERAKCPGCEDCRPRVVSPNTIHGPLTCPADCDCRGFA